MPRASQPLRIAAALLLFAVPAMALQGEPGPGAGKARAARRQSPEFQREVNAAIDRGVRWLRARQNRDGSFTGSHAANYRAGETALCAYAIAQAGGREDDRVMGPALEYLRAHPPVKTYSAGVTMLLLAELEGGADDPLAEETLEKIIDWERSTPRGTWGYPNGRIDLSNVQFAALGLWAGNRMGLDVPLGLCQRVVITTVERFLEEPREASAALKEVESQEGRSKAGETMVAGYTYEMDHGEAKGSMTVAGIAVNRIMERIHGRRLGRKAFNLMRPAERLALGWLEENLSFTRNPGAGGWPYYYLWGVERMAAFMEIDELFGRDWYQEGARHLLGKQNEDGGWSNDLDETCFAILFLARATQGGRVTSGDVGGLVSLLSEEAPLRVRVTGSWHLRGWVDSAPEGAEVERVEWLLNGEVIHEVARDAGRPGAGQRFPFERRFAREEPAVVVARAHVAWAEDAEGDGPRPATLESKPLRIPIEWDTGRWAREATAVPRPEGVSLGRAKIEASSAEERFEVDRAFDGLEGTAWRAAKEDPQPAITFTFNRSQKVRGVVISQGGSSPARVGDFDGATRIRLTVNEDEVHEFDVPDQSPARIDLALPRPARIKSLELRILATAGGPGPARGLAEVVLR